MGLATLSGQLSGNASFQVGQTVSGFPNVPWSPSLNPAGSFTGVGTTTAGQANLIFPGQYTIANSGHQDIDLTSQSIPLLAVAFARVKGLVIAHAANSLASSIMWDGTAANAFLGWLGGTNPTVTLLPGEFIILGGATANGQAVSGSHKIVRLTNNDSVNNATAAVFFIGADA
jgi:hypothetical protein